MANEQIRKEAKAKGVRLWQVAERLGISEFTMSRKLRHELSESEKEKIFKIISDLSEKEG